MDYFIYFKLMSTTSLPISLCVYDKTEFRNLTYLLACQCFCIFVSMPEIIHFSSGEQESAAAC